MSDFLQHGSRLNFQTEGLIRDHGLLRDAYRFIRETLDPDSIRYRVQIEYEDGSCAEGAMNGDGALRVEKGKKSETAVQVPGTDIWYWQTELEIVVENVATDKKIRM